MAYPADHDPPHVHATTAGVILVLTLLDGGGVGPGGPEGCNLAEQCPA
jgi:hypothetical protein